MMQEDKRTIRKLSEGELQEYKITYELPPTALRARYMVNGDVFTVWNKKSDKPPLTLEFFKYDNEVSLHEVRKIEDLNPLFSTWERTGRVFTIEQVNEMLKEE